MPQNRLNSIDLLKGVAIFAVIVVHVAQKYTLPVQIAQIAKFGQFGCQLFFVISGYMAYISCDSCKNWRLFYRKRFLAIAPGWHLTLCLFMVINLMWNRIGLSPVYRECHSFIGIIINAVFLHGFVPFCNNNGIPGGWFVGTIVAFYAMCPLLYRLLNKMRSKIMLYCCPIFAAVLSLGIQYLIGKAIGSYALSNNNCFLYFHVINQMSCILCGMVTARLGTDSTDIYSKRKIVGLAAIGGAGLLAAYGMFSLDLIYTDSYIYIYIYILCCLVCWVMRFQCFCWRALDWRNSVEPCSLDYLIDWERYRIMHI